MFGEESFLGSLLSALGGAGDWLGTAASNVGTYGADLGTSLGSAGADLGGAAWNAALNNPWQVAGLGLQGAGTLAPLFMGGGGDQSGGQMEMSPGMYSQMQQGATTPQQVRRRLMDAQSQGLSGASPDFMATMAGVTPQELNQMMGFGGR